MTSFCQLAQHCKSSTLEVKYVQLHLECQWNMCIPGFSSEEIHPYKNLAHRCSQREDGTDLENNQKKKKKTNQPNKQKKKTHGKVREWTTIHLEIFELRPQPSHPWIFFFNAPQRSIYFLLTVHQYL